MATIKEGYDGKETRLTVVPRDDHRNIELWIEQFGLPRILGKKGVTRIGKLEDLKEGENYQPSTETMAYMTINEAIALRDELNDAIREAAGL